MSAPCRSDHDRSRETFGQNSPSCRGPACDTDAPPTWPGSNVRCLTELLVSSISMNADKFEWNDQKAADNYAKHGVSFEMARDVFKDPFAIEHLDDREAYGEDRYAIIGMVDNRLLFVAYTRGDSIRIISARGAEPHEHRQYHEEGA